jgi:hypothetical protein
MLEINLTGKTTEKRQNFDFSTPPACAEHLHFTLNRENSRALCLRQTATLIWLGKMQTTR